MTDVPERSRSRVEQWHAQQDAGRDLRAELVKAGLLRPSRDYSWGLRPFRNIAGRPVLRLDAVGHGVAARRMLGGPDHELFDSALGAALASKGRRA